MPYAGFSRGAQADKGSFIRGNMINGAESFVSLEGHPGLTSSLDQPRLFEEFFEYLGHILQYGGYGPSLYGVRSYSSSNASARWRSWGIL